MIEVSKGEGGLLWYWVAILSFVSHFFLVYQYIISPVKVCSPGRFLSLLMKWFIYERQQGYVSIKENKVSTPIYQQLLSLSHLYRCFLKID